MSDEEETNIIPGEGQHITAKIPKDGLRSLFHLMVGKPDSTQKNFDRDVLVEAESIKDLHDRFTDKLKNHQIEGLVATVDISYEDNTSIQFGSWAEFLSHRWTGPEETREIILKWDFIVKIPGYDFPQRHTVMVRITGEMKPLHVLRRVFSRDIDDMDSIELAYIPIFCRIDFINHILSKELLAIAEEWNKALPQPESILSPFKKITKYDAKIAALFEYMLPFLSFSVVFAYLYSITNNLQSEAPLNTGVFVHLMYWTIVSFSLLFASINISKWLARKSLKYLNTYGRYNVFNLTNGDKTRQVELNRKNKKILNKFLYGSGFAFLLNILAGYIVVVLFTS